MSTLSRTSVFISQQKMEEPKRQLQAVTLKGKIPIFLVFVF